MAATMTCPLCQGEHPAGTTWCPEAWAEIPQADAAPPQPLDTELPEAEPSDAAPPPRAAEGPQVQCTVCGDRGEPGSSCRQCGATLPLARSDTGATPVVLELPSGERLPLPPDREVTIGRDSDSKQIRAAFAPFDAVSRVHCTVRVDAVAATATVCDLESTNGTWLGTHPKRLVPGQPRSAPLPARLRLGESLSVMILGEDGP